MLQGIDRFKPSQGEIIQAKNYFIIEAGKTFGLRTEIITHLQKQRPLVKEVHGVEDCDVILVFCPIVSRAGTDIDAALNELNAYSEFKPAIFMVLHYTFDHDKVIPDSSRYINRTNTFTVDCLFSEEGLLTCDRNEKALTNIVQYFKHQGHSEFLQMNKWCISLLYMLCTFTFGLCFWLFGKLASVWNYFTKEKRESSTNNKRSTHKDTDEEKNI
ncbi:uncharacterized protein LOC122345145 [Puntigrus tetrazona]|uniref:uncharacterized protein LOC122345145 n=1 Tax=Puntigrus tetrazona TaxID=1606681 RepID=UPI001C894160|nr:uncharacterized protein LOC122345145 [Puntigrus tetrazona]